MALELQLGTVGDFIHNCRLPWPGDPEIPEGHVCECGRRWMYQPAHWDPLLTLEELRIRQEAGDFLRGLIPSFKPGPLLGPTNQAVVVPLPAPGGDAPSP